MISATEARMIALAARKVADRSAEVEARVDQAISAAAQSGTIGTIVVVIPHELVSGIANTVRLFGANGWRVIGPSVASDELRITLTLDGYGGAGG